MLTASRKRQEVPSLRAAARTALVCLAAIALPAAAPAAWNTYGVAPAAGSATSVAADSAGWAHILFFEPSACSLSHATNAGGGWSVETAATTGGGNCSTQPKYVSVAVDAYDHLHACYHDPGTLTLRYATDAAGSWSVETVDSPGDVGNYCSIALDGSGRAHVSYLADGSEELRYASNASGSWSSETVAAVGALGGYSSIAVEAGGTARVAFVDHSSGTPVLRVATGTAGSWSFETVDTEGAGVPDIALDASGHAHVGYSVPSLSQVRHATDSSGNWAWEVVASDTYALHLSLGLEPGGAAHLAWYDGTAIRLDLGHATNGSGSWVTDTVESGGDTGQFVSLAVDVGGNVHLGHLREPSSYDWELAYAVDDDIMPPDGSVSVNAGAAWAAATPVTLSLACDDHGGSGCADMLLSNDGSAWTGPEPFAAARSWDLEAGADGPRTVHVRFSDALGRWSGDFADGIGLDTGLPSGTVSIDGGGAYALDQVVTLTLSASDTGSGVLYMSFSEDGLSWSDWETYATSSSWTFSAGDGLRELFARFRDGAGNDSSPASDTIVLDTVDPGGSLLIEDGAAAAASASVTLAISASEPIDAMRFSNDGVSWTDWEAYAPGKAGWTLETPDGTRTVRVELRDLAGRTGVLSDDILLDTTPPTCQVWINGNDPYTRATAATLGLEAYDGGSGVAGMILSEDGVTWLDWETYAATRSWTLAGDDGGKLVYARVRDGVQHESEQCWDAIILDRAAPDGSVAIEAGAAAAGGTAVWLDLAADDHGFSGPAAMELSNDGLSWQSYGYQTPLLWYLAGGEDGPRTVYVRYTDNAGNTSGPYSDGIILDTLPPEGSIIVGGGAMATSLTGVTLDLSATDAGTGVADMCFSDDGLDYTEWEPYAPARSWTLPAGDGPKTVSVRFRDALGRVSPAFADGIILDTAPPTGSVLIDGGAEFVAGHAVTLSLSVSDGGGSGGALMSFSDDGSAWSDWETYGTSKPWDLPPGEGSRCIRARFRDAAGNETAEPAQDCTVVDTLPPSGTFVLEPDPPYTNQASFHSDLQASDDGSGVADMRFSTDGASWTSWEPYATTRVWALGPGPNMLHVQFRDRAGNPSPEDVCTVTLDQEPPAGSFTLAGGAAWVPGLTVALDSVVDGTGSPVAWMRFDPGGGWSEWIAFASSHELVLPYENAANTVWGQFRDAAGNVSEIAAASVSVDTVAPTGSILVAGGAEATATAEVELTLAADDWPSGVADMCLSNDGVAWTAWEPFAATRAWTLDPGEGIRTVSVRFRDLAGNVAGFSDSILLDGTPPSGTLLVNGGAPETFGRTVLLTVAPDDPDPASLQMRFSDDGLVWSAWEPYRATRAWTLPPVPGERTVRAALRNAAGLESAPFSEAVTFRPGLDNGASPELIVPEAVWTGTGAAARTTSLALTDVTGGSAISLSFHYGAGLRRGPFLLAFVAAPGETRYFPNILEFLQGIDPGFGYAGRKGALRLTTQDGEHRLLATALSGRGTTVNAAAALDPASHAAPAGVSLGILQLASTAAFSSKLSCFNPDGAPVTASFRLRKAGGRAIGASFSRTFGAGAWKTLDPFAAAGVRYPSFSFPAVRLEINVTGGAGRLLAWGTTEHRTTRDQSHHPALWTGAHAPAGPLVVPDVASVPTIYGGLTSNLFLADLAGGSEVSARHFSSSGTAGEPVNLWTNPGGAGKGIHVKDVLSRMDTLDPSGYEYHDAGGVLLLSAQDPSRSMLATVRNGLLLVRSTVARAVPAGDDTAFAGGSRRLHILGLGYDDRRLSGVGCCNVSPDPVTLEFALEAGGVPLGAAFSFEIPAGNVLPIAPFQEAGLTGPDPSWAGVSLTVRPAGGSGRAHCWGYLLDTDYGDRAHLPALSSW